MTVKQKNRSTPEALARHPGQRCLGKMHPSLDTVWTAQLEQNITVMGQAPPGLHLGGCCTPHHDSLGVVPFKEAVTLVADVTAEVRSGE